MHFEKTFATQRNQETETLEIGSSGHREIRPAENLTADEYGWSRSRQFEIAPDFICVDQCDLCSSAVWFCSPSSASCCLRKSGNRITSRIERESVNSMVSRSMPMPSPPVGGRP